MALLKSETLPARSLTQAKRVRDPIPQKLYVVGFSYNHRGSFAAGFGGKAGTNQFVGVGPSIIK